MSDEKLLDHSATWSSEALLTKAQRYAEKMLACPRAEWEFALWSSLTLEFLLRAGLADYSPAFLADSKDLNSLMSALGFEPPVKKFIPKPINITNVINQLASLRPDKFTSELAGFSHGHTTHRNFELHSGHAAFDGVKCSHGVKHFLWLPLFYKTCKVLLDDLELDLAAVFGTDEAIIAEKLIDTIADHAAKTVEGTIAAHEKVWNAKEKAERDNLAGQATLWATRHACHRVKCPACGSDAIVVGEAIAPPHKSIKEDLITEKQEYLPNKFECVACGMEMAGISQLNAVGLDNIYVQTQTYDVNEYFAGEPNSLQGHNI